MSKQRRQAKPTAARHRLSLPYHQNHRHSSHHDRRYSCCCCCRRRFSAVSCLPTAAVGGLPSLWSKRSFDSAALARAERRRARTAARRWAPVGGERERMRRRTPVVAVHTAHVVVPFRQKPLHKRFRMVLGARSPIFSSTHFIADKKSVARRLVVNTGIIQMMRFGRHYVSVQSAGTEAPEVLSHQADTSGQNMQENHWEAKRTNNPTVKSILLFNAG